MIATFGCSPRRACSSPAPPRGAAHPVARAPRARGARRVRPQHRTTGALTPRAHQASAAAYRRCRKPLSSLPLFARSCGSELVEAREWKRHPQRRWRGITMTDRPVSVIVAGPAPRSAACSAALKDLSAADLGGVAIKGALEKAGVSGDQVDYVIMGQVIQAGAGQITARQAAVKAGIPMTVPSITINKVCLSGINAIAHGRPADPRRRARDRRRRRHGVDDQRAAPAAEVPRGLQVRRRHARRLDGLRRALRPVHRPGDGRPDRAAATPARRHLHPRGAGRVLGRSHQRAAEAWKNGLFDDEVVPVAIPQRKGDPIVVTRTRASAATPRPSRSASCARRSARTAPSPPARPRRSPTAPAPSS